MNTAVHVRYTTNLGGSVITRARSNVGPKSHASQIVTRLRSSSTTTTSTPPYHHVTTSDPHHHERARLPTNHDNRLKTKHDSHTPTSPTSTTKRAPSMSPACHVTHLTPLTTPAAQTTTTPQHLNNRATGQCGLPDTFSGHLIIQ